MLLIQYCKYVIKTEVQTVVSALPHHGRSSRAIRAFNSICVCFTETLDRLHTTYKNEQVTLDKCKDHTWRAGDRPGVRILLTLAHQHDSVESLSRKKLYRKTKLLARKTRMTKTHSNLSLIISRTSCFMFADNSRHIENTTEVAYQET